MFRLENTIIFIIISRFYHTFITFIFYFKVEDSQREDEKNKVKKQFEVSRRIKKEVDSNVPGNDYKIDYPRGRCL